MGCDGGNTGNGATGSRPSFSVPPDDGAIERALIDLDEKLSAWSARMRRADARVKEQEPAGRNPRAAIAEPAADPDVRRGPLPAPTPSPERLEQALVEPAPSSAPELPAEKCAGSEPPPESSPSKPPEHESAPPEDEEALLAGLDADTASAIRIMRRLNPSHKSVRELIQEYQAKAKRPLAAPPDKKPWWQRLR